MRRMTLLALGVMLLAVTLSLPHAGAQSSTGAAPAGCLPLPASSVCASFFPSGALVSTPLYPCMETAEASLKAGPTIWSALTQLTAASGNSTCAADFAQLMCLVTFRPCGQPLMSQAFCQATLSASAGSCRALLPFLALVVPGFTGPGFNCGAPFYSADGIGPAFPSTAATFVPHARCGALPENSVCRGVIGLGPSGESYPVYYAWTPQSPGPTPPAESFRLSFEAAMVSANPASGCLESLSKMMCALVYPRCDTTVLATSLAGKIAGPMGGIVGMLAVPFPQLPCRSLCAEVNDGRCGELLSSKASLRALANCTASGTVLRPTPTCAGAFLDDAQPNFPDDGGRSLLASLRVNGSTVALTSQCNAFATPAAVGASSVIQCPYPLVASAGPDDTAAVLHGSCALPCPTILFTRAEWTATDAFFTFIVICSFFSSLFLWLTWMIFPVKRKQTNTLMFNTCTLVLSFVMLVMIMDAGGKPSTISCKNDSEYRVQSDGGTCLFQAIIFFYFTLVGVGFWMVSAVDLYIKIVLNLKIDSQRQTKLNRGYLAGCWGIPMLLLWIALGLHAFGGANGTPWCLFNPTNNSAVDWSLFYYPIMFMVVGGAFCMCSIIGKMIKSATDTGGTRRAGWWRAQIRPFLFVFIFIFIFIFIFAYRVHLWRKEADYKLQAQMWVACIVSTMGDNDACGSKPSDTPGLGLWYMVQLAVGGEGLLNSLIFGTQWANFQLWFGLLTGKGTQYRGSAVSKGTTDSSNDGKGASTPLPKSGQTTRSNSSKNLELDRYSDRSDVPQVKPTAHVSAGWGSMRRPPEEEAVLGHMLDPELLQQSSPASPSRTVQASAAASPRETRPATPEPASPAEPALSQAVVVSHEAVEVLDVEAPASAAVEPAVPAAASEPAAPAVAAAEPAAAPTEPADAAAAAPAEPAAATAAVADPEEPQAEAQTDVLDL